MDIIINNSSMTPIYEQIYEQIKEEILTEKLKTGTNLPSIRKLAAGLKISSLTVKKAYDRLEKEEFINTVQGKGSFVSRLNFNLINEEKLKKIENELMTAIKNARALGINDLEIKEIFEELMEEL